jgi:hypothetical protein
VAPTDGSTASLPYLRRTLGEALTLHPAATMAYCSACLAAAAACRGNNSSSSRDCPDPQVTSGVQIWLRDHLLKERSPSRECTPTAAAAAAAAAKAGDALAAGSGAAGVGRNGCLLQNVLLGSEELQGWVMRQARGRATGEAQNRAPCSPSALVLLRSSQGQYSCCLMREQEGRGSHSSSVMYFGCVGVWFGHGGMQSIR